MDAPCRNARILHAAWICLLRGRIHQEQEHSEHIVQELCRLHGRLIAVLVRRLWLHVRQRWRRLHRSAKLLRPFVLHSPGRTAHRGLSYVSDGVLRNISNDSVRSNGRAHEVQHVRYLFNSNLTNNLSGRRPLDMGRRMAHGRQRRLLHDAYFRTYFPRLCRVCRSAFRRRCIGFHRGIHPRTAHRKYDKNNKARPYRDTTLRWQPSGCSSCGSDGSDSTPARSLP